jgi:sugar lactone lactonase YvrE
VLAPVVSVTKEVPQSGVTNNNWDVNSTTENYTRLNSAYATTLDWVGFDVAAASYVQNFSVALYETNPRGLAFNTDGTKMFVVGSTGGDVNEYTLSTGFDVSTASFVDSFSVSAQEGNLLSLAFSTDGTKMFVLGNSADTVFEYTLSTGFDVSTASYTQGFSVASQDDNPRGLAFSTDGTKMFMLGYTGQDVNEYTLSTGFDVSTSTFVDSFSVAAQETGPQGIAFNPEGTKMFICGFTGQDVNEYTLSTAFDVSTASYSQVFSVSAQETVPRGLAFNTSGTKMFVLGDTGNDVNEYSLPPTALALGTGSFASADVGKTIEANSGVFVLTATDGSYVETTAPTSYDQVASGSWEMYGVVYNAVDGDLQLSGGLFNAFDVDTASYVQNFSVSAQDTSPWGIAFNTDGTKMFVTGEVGRDVNEYNLSTAFDITTATFVDSFSTNAQESQPLDIAFNTNGTKMFIVGGEGQDINEYTLSTGFDVSTSTFVDSFSVSSQDTDPQGLSFNLDGTKMFVLGDTNNSVYQYTLSTGFDVSTASYDSVSFSVASQETNPQGLAFNTNGTKMFVVGYIGDDVNQYALSSGFDLSTASYEKTFSISSQDTTPRGMTFNNDGTKMFIVGATGQDINEYSLGLTAIPSGYQPVHTTASIDSTYWTDINSMTADQAAGDGNVYYAISTDDRTTWTVIDNTDGERDIVRNNAGTWQYNSNGTYASETWVNGATNTELATLAEAMEGAAAGYSLANGTYLQNFSVASQLTQPQGMTFSPDGLKMYVCGGSERRISEYSLSTSFDVSTASFVSSFSLITWEDIPNGIAFNADGTKIFICGQIGQDINEFTLSTAYTISTMSFVDSFSVSAQDTSPQDVSFNTDGTKMLVLGGTGQDVNEYTLSTGFDVSTSTFVDSFSIASEETAPRGLTFSADGTQMFICGHTGVDVNQYTLSTGFDVSTAVYSQNFSVSAQETNPEALAFNATGTKMFVVGYSSDSVNEYSTASYTNQMDKTQLDAVTDPNHIALGNDLDLSIIFNMTSGTTVPSSDGVAINYDANVLNKGAVLGTDYDFDAPTTSSVRITALAANNLKVRVV